MGTGVARWPSLCLYPGLVQPPWWQQHSRTCSGVLVPYTRDDVGAGHNGRARGRGSGPEPGRLVTHRVRTATGYRSDKCSAPLMGSFLVV